MSARTRTIILLAAIVLAGTAGAFARTHFVNAGGAAAGPSLVFSVEPFRTLGVVEPWSGAGLAQHVAVALATNERVRVQWDAAQVRPDAYVLHGTVSREGPRLAIGVHLTRGLRGDVVWTGTYWRSENDLASLAEELAGATVTAAREDAARVGR